MKIETDKYSCDFIAEVAEDNELINEFYEFIKDNPRVSLSHYDDDSDALMLTIDIK